MESNLIKKAKIFAKRAHESINQKRKYSNEPYHVHVERVAKIIEWVTDDEEVIAAAFLHDVLEDVAPHNADFNANAIKENFGERVLQLVLEVTDVSKPSDGNRDARKSIDRMHLLQASKEGKTIKLADLIDNIIDISEHDPSFAIVFKKEASRGLVDLKEGSPLLFRKLEMLLSK